MLANVAIIFIYNKNWFFFYKKNYHYLKKFNQFAFLNSTISLIDNTS